MSKIKLLVAFLHQDHLNLLSEAEFAMKFKGILGRLSARDLKYEDLLKSVLSIKRNKLKYIAIESLLQEIIAREHIGGEADLEAGGYQVGTGFANAVWGAIGNKAV